MYEKTHRYSSVFQQLFDFSLQITLIELNKHLCIYEIYFIIVFYFPIVHTLTLFLPFANINET